MKTSSPRIQNINYRQIFEIIRDAGEEGILQSDLWKITGDSSREGSRVAFKLMKAGLVRRLKKLHKGKWTFVLISNKYSPRVDSIIEQPCAFCIVQEKCGEPKYVTPVSCARLTEYMQSTASN